MRRLHEVPVHALDARRLGPLVGDERMGRLSTAIDAAREALAGRAVLNVNSTPAGGGVAELLQTLVGYARGGGVDARWLAIGGDPEFFAVTKRIHNGLYGTRGDGGALVRRQRLHYDAVLRRNAEELLALVRRGDVVVLHDPQTAGLAAAAKRAGAIVVWRCHVGRDAPNEWTERAWGFLEPLLTEVDAIVVSRAAFAPPWRAAADVDVIPPSIDPFSAKNAPLDSTTVRDTLAYVGLLAGRAARRGPILFARPDGSPGRISRHVDVLHAGPPPAPDTPLVVQVSRWDRLKDMAGVMAGFAEHVDRAHGAHLLLVGPAVSGVADDPEASTVLGECFESWRRLPHAARARIHLACTPMRDLDEQATIVNAIQRHAAIVVQKSLSEGFGLTVAEAMWKQRPIVASAVGGIRDQIVAGEQGLLVEDPHDLAGFGAAVEQLLRDPEQAARLAAGARARAGEELLGDRHIERWGALLARLVDGRAAPPSPSRAPRIAAP